MVEKTGASVAIETGQRGIQRLTASRALRLACAVCLLAALTGCGEIKRSGARSGGSNSRAGIAIRIIDRLAPGQVGEQATITVGGVTKMMILDEETPSAYLEFRLKHPGMYNCSLHTETVYVDRGELAYAVGAGQGTLSVSGGEQFELMIADPSRIPNVVTLVQRR